MDSLDALEALIRAQDPSAASAAAVLARLGTPSTSIAILSHGRIAARAFSTLGHDTDTVFQACSISKPIAALTTLKLVHAGTLTLDAPITTYLSARSLALIATPATQPLLRCITLRQLLSHSAGLSQGGFPGYSSTKPASAVPPITAILAGNPASNTPQVRLAGLPGHRFAYSGGGTTVLQLVLEEATGQPFAALAHALVLAPLGMHRSFYATPASESDNFAPAYRTGAFPCDPPFHVLPERAAAGLWTTPSDLLKVVAAVQGALASADGDGSDEAFLPRALARDMLTEVRDGFALGWIAPREPGTTFSHSGGNDPGYRCYLLGYADVAGTGAGTGAGAVKARSEGCGMCVMTNSAEGHRLYPKLMMGLAFLNGWGDIRGLNVLSAPLAFVARETGLDQRWKEWCGAWGEGEDEGWVIAEDDGEGGGELKGLPVVRFRELPSIRLLAAARPVSETDAGVSAIDAVMEGLDMMLRLGQEKGEKIVEVWSGLREDVVKLRRAEAK